MDLDHAAALSSLNMAPDRASVHQSGGVILSQKLGTRRRPDLILDAAHGLAIIHGLEQHQGIRHGQAQPTDVGTTTQLDDRNASTIGA